MTARKLTITAGASIALALVLSWAAAMPNALAAPLAAGTATPAATRAAKPTRTPRPTATPKAPKMTPTPALTSTMSSGVLKLNPEASFALAQKDPCGLVKRKGLNAAPVAKDGRTWCEYSAGQTSFEVVEIDRDDKGAVLAKSLARFDVNKGCGRDKTPAEADLKPYLSKPLVEKLKLLIDQANKCGSKYVPVPELGPNAFNDKGNVLIVVDNYLMNAYVQSPKPEAGVALAKEAFVR